MQIRLGHSGGNESASATRIRVQDLRPLRRLGDARASLALLDSFFDGLSQACMYMYDLIIYFQYHLVFYLSAYLDSSGFGVMWGVDIETQLIEDLQTQS